MPSAPQCHRSLAPRHGIGRWPTRVRHAAGWAVVALTAAAPPLGTSGQTQSRVATTRNLLLENPLFYHSRTVAIVDTPRLVDGVWRLPSPERQVLVVVFRTAPSSDQAVEIRGTFIDVGRLAPDDSRVTAFGLQPIVQTVMAGTGSAWPARETFFAIVNATSAPAPEIAVPSIRALALFPEKFDGKPVTLRGRFRGRNLAGDLPIWPRQSDSDFVLQAADGAVWIAGLKPKGKGFDLDPNARRDLGRWLEVTGTASLAKGLPVIKATSIKPAAPEEDLPAEEKPAAPVLPPPSLSFSIPTDGETGIDPAITVRAQFSRDMKAESFETHVQLSCTAAGTAVPCPTPKLAYRAASLTLEITFDEPLPRLATITISFRDGITTNDGVALKPTAITFTTGG